MPKTKPACRVVHAGSLSSLLNCMQAASTINSLGVMRWTAYAASAWVQRQLSGAAMPPAAVMARKASRKWSVLCAARTTLSPGCRPAAGSETCLHRMRRFHQNSLRSRCTLFAGEQTKTGHTSVALLEMHLRQERFDLHAVLCMWCLHTAGHPRQPAT